MFYNLDACLPENPKNQMIQVETEMLGPGISKSEWTGGQWRNINDNIPVLYMSKEMIHYVLQRSPRMLAL